MTLLDAKKQKIDDFAAGQKVNLAMPLEDQVGALRKMVGVLAAAAKVPLEPDMILLEKAVSDAKPEKIVEKPSKKTMAK